MSKALVTFGVGAARELLDIAEPGFRDYAARHGYEFLICDDIPNTRPAAWFKVPVILEALKSFDEVLWLDADVLILRPEDDIADEVIGTPEGAWQALVTHHTPDGEVPNTGVWLCRQPMIPVLEHVWTRYLNHPWWEQAAVCELMGYNPWQRPMVRRVDTPLWAHTRLLGNEWNSHRDDEHPDPRFWHATVRGDRAKLMRHRATFGRRPEGFAIPEPGSVPKLPQSIFNYEKAPQHHPV